MLPSSPPKKIENLHARNGCFNVFRIIFRHILFKFFTLTLSASKNYYPKPARTFLSELVSLERIDRFLVIGEQICNQISTKKYNAFSRIFDYAYLRVIVIEEVRNCRKN